ncbi:MAG: AarF/ABC1/UbiB kinase family protein [bacterium]|nr:AarF/ABC1/UbiB kinase family protein [bacterium]
MLKSKRIPTPLIEPEERDPIVTETALPDYAFREWHILREFFRLLFNLARLKITKQLTPRKTGMLLRNFCERLGVLWIKFGQLLSLRVDLLSSEICDELSGLQDQARGFSPEIARQILEQELGASIDAYFSDFGDAPFAAASISQVHKAYLKPKQCWVAIKVLKPHSVEIFQRDMRVLYVLMRLLIWVSFKPYMRWQDMYWEIHQIMKEELDYRYETTNMRRMKKSLQRHKVYVPKIFHTYSTRHVLVMEYIQGVLMSDYLNIARHDPERLKQWLKTNNVCPELLGKRLFFTNMRQLVEDNLFHGDLHPGNIVLLRDSKIAFIDFGSIGFSDRDFLRKYFLFIEALTEQKYAKAFDIYLLFPDHIPAVDLTHLREGYVEAYQDWHERCRIEELTYDEKSLNSMNDSLLTLLSEYQIAMPWHFLRFMRATSTLDAALRELIPRVDSFHLTDRYLKKREERFTQQSTQQRRPVVNLTKLVEFPVTLNESMFFRRSIARRLAQEFEGLTTKVAQGIDRLFTLGLFALQTVCVFSGLLLADQLHLLPLHLLGQNTLTDIVNHIPNLDLQVWLLWGLFLLHSHHILAKLRKRFRQT